MDTNKKTSQKKFAGWKKIKDGYLYYFKDGVSKKYRTKKLEFRGFKEIPAGLSLYRSGGGFNFRQTNKIGGDYFLKFLSDKYQRQLKVVILKTTGKRAFKVLSRSVALKISFDDFQAILKDLGYEIKSKQAGTISKRLADFFPDIFRADQGDNETINSKLSGINLNNLKTQDHETVTVFIKKYLKLLSDSNNKALKKLQTELVIQGKKRTLEDVIRRFERHIKNKKFSEKQWQKFLHEEVFYFIANYIESIRETDVNFGKTDEGEKKPDFVWIDIYGFLDVFEIKTPHTSILAKRIDKSHKNYYFSSDAVKAISQIEKYILFLEKNVENYERHLSKKTKIPFSVLKPKAFLILGDSKEFEKAPGKKKDFRLLRRLFKNIEFITFDELLDNLRSLASKFEKEIK